MPADEPSRPALDLPALDALRATGWRVEVVRDSPSTNAVVAERARSGELPGLVVVAEHQTAGRGRLDRTWVTPPRAALTFSLLVAPDRVPLVRWPWLPLLTGLAVADGVRLAGGLDASLKWPNDVLVADSKVAGILVERVERQTGALAVVGVGINVSATREELPVATATSLALSGATSLDRAGLLVEVLESFTLRYDAWQAAAGQGVRASYVSACSTLGRDVRVDLPDGVTLHGRAVGVDTDGRLQVDDGSRVHVLGAGDVVHVRVPHGSGPPEGVR